MSAGSGQEGVGFQERLRAHLHSATAQAGGSAGSGNPRYFPTEACAAAAAAMVLAKQLGNIQVSLFLLVKYFFANFSRFVFHFVHHFVIQRGRLVLPHSAPL